MNMSDTQSNPGIPMKVAHPERADLTFFNLECEGQQWYAVFINKQGIKFKVTPLDMKLNGHTYVDMVGHVRRQQQFSIKNFGPIGQGQKPEGVIKHLEKEIAELKLDPNKSDEWYDVIILGFDGLIKNGLSPEEIVDGLRAKLTKNENRTWPDWRKLKPDEAIEHVRTPEEEAIKAQELAGKQVELNFDANGTQVTE